MEEEQRRKEEEKRKEAAAQARFRKWQRPDDLHVYCYSGQLFRPMTTETVRQAERKKEDEANRKKQEEEEAERMRRDEEARKREVSDSEILVKVLLKVRRFSLLSRFRSSLGSIDG